jgi:predicted negative regulator of RcsB-dependent stress response
MAAHLDLDEQEQIAQMRHFWSKYGNAITWVLIVVLGGFAAWNGWQYWQQKTALQAAALYDELERAVPSKDADKIQRVWSDLQNNGGSTVQTYQGGLLAAMALTEAGKPEAARAALAWVVDKSNDDALAGLARIRLAGLELDVQAYDKALALLEGKVPVELAPLVWDRKGDIQWAQGKADAARDSYRQAYRGLTLDLEYRRIVEAKLNALGVNAQDLDAQRDKS